MQSGFRGHQPDYSYLPQQHFAWTETVYGDLNEIIPEAIPKPLGNTVTTTTTVDANLNHCKVA